MEIDPNTTQPPRRRGQFTLRSILLFFVAVQILLGLTAFLKHVGFVFSCFAIATALGWRLRKWRMMAAALTGLLVFLTTYLACWVGMGYQSHMHFPKYARYNLIRIEKMLAAYAEEEGNLPDSLSDLADMEGFHFEIDEDGDVLDSWGRPYHYEKTTDGFELATLGRDAAFGGTGLDADIYSPECGNPPESRLPLMEYMFETRTSEAVFLVAAFASFSAAIIWYGAYVELDRPKCSLILGVLATTVAAVVVAFFLAAFYIAALQSGH